MFWVDDIQWSIPCDIKRTAEMRDSEISGLMLDKTQFHDVIGTYMVYTVTLAVPTNMLDEYSELYLVLTEPVGSHMFMLPYMQGTITITGKVDSITDDYVRLPHGNLMWKGVSFTIRANNPSRVMSLGEAIDYWNQAIPQVNAPEEGDTYTYTGGEWVPVNEE